MGHCRRFGTAGLLAAVAVAGGGLDGAGVHGADRPSTEAVPPGCTGKPLLRGGTAAISAHRQRLGKQVPDDMPGLAADDLAEAMSHPKAGAVIEELMAREERSVKQGEPAPDFTLPWLPGSGDGRGEALTLSDHFGRRPVALIFGSYT